jgi:hypothetical protein
VVYTIFRALNQDEAAEQGPNGVLMALFGSVMSFPADLQHVPAEAVLNFRGHL